MCGVAAATIHGNYRKCVAAFVGVVLLLWSIACAHTRSLIKTHRI